MKTIIYIKQTLLTIACSFLLSCESFLEIPAPDNKMVSQEVFNSDATAKAAITGIYNQLFYASYSSGGTSSVTLLSSLSGKDLASIRTTNIPYMEFQQYEIMPDNTRNLSLWSSGYNIIYMVNAVLDGLNTSNEISPATRDQLTGEAKFLRAFTYFYLTNLYGDVPLILNTPYGDNELASRKPQEDVYSQIIDDLTEAQNLLSHEYEAGERTKVTTNVAKALLARVYLYQENWELAEKFSSEVISETSTYEILDDLNTVFLQNSREAIWQISPRGGGGSLTQTQEGANFIMNDLSIPAVKLAENLAESFNPQDKRGMEWIGFHEGRDSYFAYKYKDWNSWNNLTEYSMVLRLAEQHLIRAEARTMQDNLTGAIEDINIIRDRAGLDLIEESPDLDRESLFALIIEERKKELFTEWGHRWLDLKRTSLSQEILGADSATWESTDVLYPIPEQELLKNPNLRQNPGY